MAEFDPPGELTPTDIWMGMQDELARLRGVIARAREALGTFAVSLHPLRPEDGPFLGEGEWTRREAFRAIAAARAILDGADPEDVGRIVGATGLPPAAVAREGHPHADLDPR